MSFFNSSCNYNRQHENGFISANEQQCSVGCCFSQRVKLKIIQYTQQWIRRCVTCVNHLIRTHRSERYSHKLPGMAPVPRQYSRFAAVALTPWNAREWVVHYVPRQYTLTRLQQHCQWRRRSVFCSMWLSSILVVRVEHSIIIIIIIIIIDIFNVA